MKGMTEQELDKLKDEIGYHRSCDTCVNCGECDRILEMVIREQQEAQGKEKPCGECGMNNIKG